MPSSRSRQSAADTQVRLFPRRKLTGGNVPEKGRAPLKVDIVAIKSLFGRPQSEAAAELGISLTALKQICRKLGVPRWPYQRPCKSAARTGKSPSASAESTRSAAQSDSFASDEATTDSEMAEYCASAADTEDESTDMPEIKPDQSDSVATPTPVDAGRAHREWMEEADLLKQLLQSRDSPDVIDIPPSGDDLSWMIAIPEDDHLPVQMQYDADWMAGFTESTAEHPRQSLIDRCETTPLFFSQGCSNALPFEEVISQRTTAHNSPRVARQAASM